ncbi:hypothetical protein GKJPGBOP_07681 [Streptomyces paromomycinus]|uniref:Uncharacterized protein n=1 Tax=Streptomyces paromomycinus TaxID=92743 RepID=A0A401WEY9_STREY|nr:hypothetical protein GKJPGBOP_07681 [Streptomyces paromomycinus]
MGYRVGVPEPGGGVQVEAVLEAAGPVRQAGRQCGLEFELGRRQDRAQAQFPRGPRHTGQEQ